MATWLSTHGIGAIKDTNSTFVITADAGSASVNPSSASQLTGWIHFTIPSPPNTNPNLKTLAVDFSTQQATVDQVQVYLANDQVFSKTNLQKGQSFQLSIASTSAVYNGKGVAVSVYLKFNNVNSTLNFQSVAIEV
ncbi:hypothetical protein DL767_001520 [Monosporascus sp. MG133]|nr:hypothetical protein DL767_001520 [Monosporascus sp. MG133]